MSTPAYVAYEIPTSATPLSSTLQILGVQYQITLKYNSIAAAWVLDIMDNNGNPLVTGVPLVTGLDLLEPYAYLGIGGRLYAQTDNDPDAVPTFTNLGSTGHLYFVVVEGD